MEFKQRIQKGFTLVELIIVIVILGILAAFIIPKFGAIATEARTASLEGMMGNLRSAASMAHAQQVALSLAAAGSVTMDGATVTMTNGYPTDNASGIVNALGQYSGFATNVTIDTDAIAFTLSDAPTSTTCYVKYTASASANSLPTIATTTGGC
jgi:MSHA pilin protein MshA